MQSSILLLGLLASGISAVPLDQQPLADPHVVTEESHETQVSPIGASTSGLHGRFLHITGTCETIGHGHGHDRVTEQIY